MSLLGKTWDELDEENKSLRAENERYKDSLGRIINLSEGMRFDVYDRTGFISELRAINGAARQALQPPKEPDNG